MHAGRVRPRHHPRVRGQPEISVEPVVGVAGENIGKLLVDVNLCARSVEDDGEREEGGVGVVLFVVAVGGVKVLVEEVGEER